MKRNAVFVIQICWLVALGVLAGLYFNYGDTVLVANPLGPIPIGVVWFGALGAVLFSLNGINDHAHDWDPTFYLWHLSRPLMGAALAVIGVLIVKAGVLAIGVSPPASATVAPSVASAPEIPKDLLFYLVAFLVGYREETFRDLMKKFADLFMTTAPAKPEKTTAPTITDVQPSKAPIAGHIPVLIKGSGLAGATAVLFGTHPATFHIDSDTCLTVSDLPANDTAGSVPVVVKTEAGAASASFQYAA